MSKLEITDGISRVIVILDASRNVRMSAPRDIQLPKTLETALRQLPPLSSILRACHGELDAVEETLPTDVIESSQEIVQNCKTRARRLRDIVEDTIFGGNADRVERYEHAVKNIGGGERAEQLLRSISEDTRKLVDHHGIKSAQPDLILRLEELIGELAAVEPSIQRAEPSSRMLNNINYGGGSQNINTGDAHHSGTGDLHNYGGVGAIYQFPLTQECRDHD